MSIIFASGNVICFNSFVYKYLNLKIVKPTCLVYIQIYFFVYEQLTLQVLDQLVPKIWQLDNLKKNLSDAYLNYNCKIQFDWFLLFKASALWADAFYKSKCLSVCPCVCPSVCVLTFEVPFKRLFAPTSQSWMSNIFRDSESLGKSSGKKWSHIWKILFGNCPKSPRKKKFVFWLILPYKTW